MPRIPDKLPRARAIGNYYHIVLRGNRRETLFATPAHRRALNHIAIRTLRRYDATLHAYCLMPTHFRFLVQIKDRLLVKALRRIVTRYSRYRQRDLPHDDELFERPHEAQRIATNGDFLNILRRIHLSPMLAHSVTALDEYRWSSHRAYLGYKSVAWITTDFGLSLLSSDPAQARSAYHRFISDGLAIEVDDEQMSSGARESGEAALTDRPDPIEPGAHRSSDHVGATLTPRYLSIY